MLMKKKSKGNDPIDTFIEFQRWRGKAPHRPDTDDADASHINQGWPDYRGYSAKTIRKLKQNHPDYRPGPVKIWSDEEIKAYTKALEEDKDV
jgi:hypothetical protein